MNIAIMAFRWCQYGGWPTYMGHLTQGLEAGGHSVSVFSVESPTGHGDWVQKYKGPAQLANFDCVLVAVVPSAEPSTPPLMARDFRTAHVPYFCVIHDPTEMTPPVMNFLKGAAGVITIRTSMMLHPMLNAKNMIYIPHPYQRWCTDKLDAAFARQKVRRSDVFISTSRIDYDKHTEMLLALKEHEVELWTGSINRMFVHQKLGMKDITKHPSYRGAWKLPHENPYWSAIALVDMSAIAGDGGGTQYTFLEAMDHGCLLVLNAKWATWKASKDELKPLTHYIPAGTVNALQEVLDTIHTMATKKPTTLTMDLAEKYEAYNKVLRTHDAKAIGNVYTEYMRRVLQGKPMGVTKGITQFLGVRS